MTYTISATSAPVLSQTNSNISIGCEETSVTTVTTTQKVSMQRFSENEGEATPLITGRVSNTITTLSKVTNTTCSVFSLVLMAGCSVLLTGCTVGMGVFYGHLASPGHVGQTVGGVFGGLFSIAFNACIIRNYQKNNISV